MRFSRLILLGAALLQALPAYASSLRMHGQATSGPPTPIASFTVQQGVTSFANLSTALASMADNPVTVTVNGCAAFQPWPLQTQTSGSAVWYKRELLDFLTVDTTACSPGATPTWTFAGAISGTVSFTVPDYLPTIHYSIGNRNPARVGGLPLSKLPGTHLVADYTLTDASGCFDFDSDNNLTWKGTAYKGTKTCASPTLGASAYTMTVLSGSTSRTTTVVWDVNTNELNAAVHAGDSGTNEIAYAMTHQLYCGDNIIAESGTYANPSSITFPTGLGPSATNLNPATSQACPTVPYGSGIGTPTPTGAVSGYWPNDTYDPGWVTVKSRDPSGASMNALVGVFVDHQTNQDAFLRFSNFNNTSIFMNNNNGTGFHWFMADHNDQTNFGWALNSQKLLANNWFVVNNYLHSTVPQPSVGVALAIGGIGFDSQIFGNWFDNVTEDVTNPSILDSVVTTGTNIGKSLVAYNFGRNKNIDSGAHPDVMQSNFTGAIPYENPPDPTLAYADGTVVQKAAFLANVMGEGKGHQVTQDDVDNNFRYCLTRALVSPADLGYAFNDVHNYFGVDGTRSGAVQFNGYISGTTLTSTTSISISNSQRNVTGPGVAIGTVISAAGTGTTFTVNISQTVGSVGSPVAMSGNTGGVGGNLNHLERIAGNFHIAEGFHGLEPPQVATGSIITHNAEVMTLAMYNDPINNPTGYYGKGILDDGGHCTSGQGPFTNGYNGFQSTSVTNGHNLYTAGDGFGGPAGPIPTNKDYAISISTTPTVAISTAAALWVNPFIGGDTTNLASVVNAWTPKPGSAVYQSDGLPAGPFGDTTMIDFRRRWYDPAKLFN